MTAEQKKEVVRGLAESIANTICELIDKGAVPIDWNGLELRHLLADHFKMNAPAMERKRAKDYRNTVLVKNL